MAIDLDPRFTFDAFVVGPGSRLAAAAAGRVAEAPGTTYNPLFIYSGSGLGKTHLLTAIGHQAHRLHSVPVLYETTEHLMEEISRAIGAGETEAFRARLRGARLLLIDDVQFLTGQRQTQEELIRTWDAITSRGGQVVLSSDRPPQDIDGLDERLLTRLSGGLIVDMSPPDYETRVAIARRKADERGQTLASEVCEAVARIAFTNVRELQGALNRLMAVQELERRTVTPEEVIALLGSAALERGRDEFGEFLSEITGTMSEAVDEADRMIADAILTWEGEGYRTRRLDAALAGTLTAGQAVEVIRRFEADVARLKEIETAIRTADPAAVELGRTELLRDPDRVAEAEALLAAVRERGKSPPGPPAGPSLDRFGADRLPVRAARAVVEAPGEAYNPLYVLGPEGTGKSALLAAIGNDLLASRPALLVGYLDAATFSAELIDALEANQVDAWRARYRRMDVLLLDDLEQLAGTERAQEELFHLFEALYRAGRQLVFAASVPPQELPVPARLRGRLESGLVVELEPGAHDGAEDGPVAVAPEPLDRRRSHWILSREKVLWEWPYAADWFEESLD